MFPWMMPLPQMQPSVQPSSSSSSASSPSSSSSSSHGDDEKPLHRGATILAGIPKKRIQQLLEAVSEVLGATFAAELPTEDLSRLLWLTTRAKPSTRVVNFRAKTYNKDLCTKFRRSSERVRRSLGEDGWTALINDIVQFEPGKDHFRILAQKSGFDEGWLQASRKRKGSNERWIRGSNCSP